MRTKISNIGSLACLVILASLLIGSIGGFSILNTVSVLKNGSVMSSSTGSPTHGFVVANYQTDTNCIETNAAAAFCYFPVEQLGQNSLKTSLSFCIMTIAMLLLYTDSLLMLFGGIHLPYNFCTITAFIHKKDGMK